MKNGIGMAGGMAGSVVLTALHETIRKTVPGAPRMDLMGVQALAKLLHKSGIPLPDAHRLYAYVLGGDLAGNAAYYGLAGIGNKKSAPLKGAVLGALAGLGAIGLPKPLGLSPAFSTRKPLTVLLTLGIYFAGGIAAGLVMKHLDA
jgi:hypothetical protein